MRNYYKSIKLFARRLKKIELNALLVYDDRYIKTKIRTYSDKVYTNFRGLNVPEDDIKYKSFKVIFLILELYTKISITSKYI